MSTKRRRRHSPEQVVKKLRDADAMLNAGQDLAAVSLLRDSRTSAGCIVLAELASLGTCRGVDLPATPHAWLPECSTDSKGEDSLAGERHCS